MANPISQFYQLAEGATANALGLSTKKAPLNAQTAHWFPGTGDLLGPTQADKKKFGLDNSGNPAHATASAPGFNPQQTIASFLGDYNTNGADPNKVYQFLKDTNPKSLTEGNLPKALQQFASSSQWTPNVGGSSDGAGGAGGQSAGMAAAVDPLAVQMFFQNTIAPYLKQLGAPAQAPGINPLLPQQFRGAEQQNQANMASDFNALNTSTQAAALNQPRMDQIATMLGAEQKASLQDYYKTLATGATANPTGTLVQMLAGMQ